MSDVTVTPTEAPADDAVDQSANAIDETPVGDYTSESTTTVSTPREISDSPGAATGRRKQAIARVRITPGTGRWTVNGKTLDDYFPDKVHQQLVNDPFKVLDVEGRYDVVARLHGGGVSGQAGALRLGIARCLNGIDVEGNRPSLKKAGFLTRDPRAKERYKAGLKKARKAPQYSKR
ncbi:MAG TPA: 30S ribosomal protein S9 [Actinomycetes bacterium]|nr:30S ribosomal protein S9 [Actinomycetes bacterium]